jgi:hypothetical protein
MTAQMGAFLAQSHLGSGRTTAFSLSRNARELPLDQWQDDEEVQRSPKRLTLLSSIVVSTDNLDILETCNGRRLPDSSRQRGSLIFW